MTGSYHQRKIRQSENNACISPTIGHNSSMSKPKKFWSKQAARFAVEECQRHGWRAGVAGQARPYFVDAIGYADDRRVMIRYDLHDDGHMHEYSRKEVMPC